MHATWQALQPMHLEMSISLATSMVWRWLGESVVVAERRVMSNDCSGMIGSPYIFSMSTRKDLNSGVWEFASPTTGVRVLVR